MSLNIVDYSIAQLKEMGNPKNPRWMPEQQMEALQASLKEFGLVEPLIVNTRTNQIVGGHQRVQAAEANGEESLPAVTIDVSPTEETALNLALNKIKGYWDYEKLAQLLAELPAEQLIATGFSQTEVDGIVASYAPTEEIADYESGVVEDVRNRSDEEVEELLESTEKVQFGMFAKAIPTAVYSKWVAMLESKSENGTSPAALGAVVAELLGIDLLPQAEQSEDVEPVEYNFNEVGEEEEEEVFA